MKKSTSQKCLQLILSVMLAVTAVAGNTYSLFAADVQSNEEIVVLYTNDVHCGIDDAIGYAGLAAYKKETEQKGTPVMLVDCGDAVQGGVIGSLSKGEAIIDIMNAVGYDLAIPGNHEFDYTVPQFMKLTELADFPYISCNFKKTETDELVLEPYEIKEIGGKRIGFIGVATPETLTTSTTIYFQDAEENYIYGFGQGKDGRELYDIIQNTVDEVRAKKVDYCILLAHLGIDESAKPYMSTDIISNTSGIDVVLDGHSHSTVEMEKVKNKDGQAVVLSQTGTKLNSIGKLTLEGESVKTELISDYTEKDRDIEQLVNAKKEEYDKILKQKQGKTEFPLYATTPEDSNVWLTRNNETNMADFCTDAYRYVTDAEIAVIGGGSVRANIPAGDITYEDLLAVNPFGDDMGKMKIKGSNLADALEYGASYAPEKFGGFLQVSGITYDIDLDKKAEIITDENGVLTEIKGDERRVSNIKINGEPIDYDREYILAGSAYTIFKDGDGNSAFKGEKIPLEKPMKDVEALVAYVESLGGEIPDKYADVYGEGRIRFLSGADETTKTQNITVLFNGNELSTDVEPYIKNDSVLIPARAIFEALGAEVDFDAETKTVTANRGDVKTEISIGSEYAFVNGEKIQLAVPSEIQNSRTMVPLRFVSDAFEAKTDWESESKTAVITAVY